jgi:hypothetical protein
MLELKLGKLPATEDFRDLRFARYAEFGARLPSEVGRLARVSEFETIEAGVLGNDRWRDCVWAGAAYETMALARRTGGSVSFTTTEVLSAYAMATGFDVDAGAPGRNPTDVGTSVRDALKTRAKVGLRDASGISHRIDGYAKLVPGDTAELCAALWLFYVVGIGLRLPDSALAQFAHGDPWEVTPGARVIGGHYVPCLGRVDNHLAVVAWGRLQEMTVEFFRTYCDEAWVPVVVNALGSGTKTFPFDLQALESDLHAYSAALAPSPVPDFSDGSRPPPAAAPAEPESAPGTVPDDFAAPLEPPAVEEREESTPEAAPVTAPPTPLAPLTPAPLSSESACLAAEAATVAAAAVAQIADAVDCTVFTAPGAWPGSTTLVQVFLHTPGQAADAAALAAEFDPDATRRGFRGLEVPLPAGSLVQIELTVVGGHVEDPVQRLVWQERPEAVQFVVTVPEDPPEGTLIGTVIVRRDGVPIGKVSYRVNVSRFVPVGREARMISGQRRFERAFASYASPDRREVLKRVQVLRAAGIECFQDVLDLEPGQRWERELYRRIDTADLFLLFWSRSAKQSEWVRREVDYALGRQKGDPEADPDIRPVVIEGPPVELPWPDLSYLHFFDPLVHLLA